MCAAKKHDGARRSRSALELKNDSIILTTAKKIAEISVITSQLVIKVVPFPFCLNLSVAGDGSFKW